MTVTLTEHPTDIEWMECKRRALVTVGRVPKELPSMEWKKKILAAKHSPIRYLTFSFDLEVPYWVSVHLCRHIHAQPYVRSQRNDRQNEYDRNSARQDEAVRMIWDMNAEELITICQKRLCNQASPETRHVVELMRDEVLKVNPEFAEELVPPCARYGKCLEMKPCGVK